MDENQSDPQDQEHEIAMVDAAGDGAPHGGQEQDGQPDQELLPNLEAPRSGQQEGQQQDKVQGAVPPKIIKRMECKRLLERISFSVEVAQNLVWSHGYDTAKKFSHLKSDDIDILKKTLCSPGTELADGTRPRHNHSSLGTKCFDFGML